MCYACISVVTNYAAGVGAEPLRHGDVIGQMKKMESALQDYVVNCLSNTPADRKCGCKTAPIASKDRRRSEALYWPQGLYRPPDN